MLIILIFQFRLYVNSFGRHRIDVILIILINRDGGGGFF